MTGTIFAIVDDDTQFSQTLKQLRHDTLSGANTESSNKVLAKHLRSVISAGKLSSNFVMFKGPFYLQWLEYVTANYVDTVIEGYISSSYVPNRFLETYLEAFDYLLTATGQISNKQFARVVALVKIAITSNQALVSVTFNLPPERECYLDRVFPWGSDLLDIDSNVSLSNRASGEVINISGLNHVKLSDKLHYYAFDDGEPRLVPILYDDGSQCEPFPCGFLTENKKALEKLSALNALKVGMVSNRHPEMDQFIDFYWFRNDEVSIGKTLSESDKIAYEKSIHLLQSLRKHGEVKIEFYQTGYEPAVVGFYRAVTNEITYRYENNLPLLLITPMYYEPSINDYQPGKSWY